jgi:hypothetical protein
MKKIFLLIATVITFTGCDILSQMGVPLTEADVANGLKQALIQGVNRGAEGMFAVQGNGNTALLNQLLPREAVSLINTAKSLGFGPQIEKFTNSLNTAAVNSVKNSVPIFVSSITSMNVKDAWSILRGAQNAATMYLQNTTQSGLISVIRPEVMSVFNSLGLKSSLLANLGTSNALLKGLDIDLSGVLTNLITTEMFKKVAEEEVRIRTDINSRTTMLMQRVFAAATQPAPAPAGR